MINRLKKGAVVRVFPALPENKRGIVPEKQALETMPRTVVEALGAFVFEHSDAAIKIAATDPESAPLRAFVEKTFSAPAELYRTDRAHLERVLAAYARDFRNEISALAGDGSTPPNGNIVGIVDRIIAASIEEKASDIHIEPGRTETLVRFRIDGILHPLLSIPASLHTALMARFKILAGLKIDEYRRPQDGRIELPELAGISLRLSVIPTLYGEKIVLRVLNDAHKNFALPNLGFLDAHAAILKRNMEKPFGMVVTSGPTGSGKTTTLYGLLNLLERDGINVSTLEDPIEYALPGMNQVQINPRADLTFASGLRSLLRQDPDVIMVGEVRDSETAVMAANAALTGHLVLTTMHTNDAASAFSRLLEMRVEDFVVGSIMNLVIAQRLVRKICGSCATEKRLEPALVKKIGERKDLVATLERQGYSLDSVGKRKFVTGAGCDACIQTGYDGRVGIFEMLELSKNIHDLILAHAPTEKIKEAAEKEGFADMLDDGVKKVYLGMTTFDEVLRTTRNA